MTAFAKVDITTAAEVLKLEQTRRALKQLAVSDGIYTPGEKRYDPSKLEEDSRKARVLRKMRECAGGRLPSDVEEYILAKPDVVQVAVAPTKVERFGFVAAILSAVILAPLAIAGALLALASPSFTGFANAAFPIALAEHLVYHATHAEITGYVAALSMLLTFSMTNMVMLRLFAVIGNIFFISYGIGSTLVPVVLLHMILLPVNIGHLSRALHNQGARFWQHPEPEPVPARN